jgi:hypothetical protein
VDATQVTMFDLPTKDALVDANCNLRVQADLDKRLSASQRVRRTLVDATGHGQAAKDGAANLER